MTTTAHLSMIVFDVSTVRIDVCAPSVYVASRRPLGSDLSLILCLLPRHDSTGGNYDSRFDVGKASGTLIVARPLDAEQKSSYNLTVEATDGTRSVSTQVTGGRGGKGGVEGGAWWLDRPVCWDLLMSATLSLLSAGRK